MNRVLRWSVLVGLAAIQMPLAAMEFGTIKVRSNLGQPLLAEVSLRPEQAGELSQIKVSLATASDFAQAGIDTGPPSLPLEFTVVDLGGGERLLRISCSQVVTDPYLDLLVSVSTAQGTSLHELPILLDPVGTHPVAVATRAEPVVHGTIMPARRPSPVVRSAPIPRPATTARPAPAPHAAAAANPSTDTAKAAGQQVVKPGQTLFKIARDTRPHGVSVDQMMLAYQQVNPQAFYSGNLSALKAGSILRTPTRSEALSMTRVAAFQAVYQQTQAWHSSRAAPPVLLANASGAAQPVPVKAPPAAASDRLALVAGHGQGSTGPRDKLTEEALRSSQQQEADLSSRIHDLQVMEPQQQRLIALKNQQIAELQQQLQGGHPAAASAPPVAPTGPAKPASTSALASASVAASVAASAHAPAARPTPAVAAPAAVDDTPWYQQLWVQLIGVVVLLLLLLGYARQRRAKKLEANPVRTPAAVAPRPSLAQDPAEWLVPAVAPVASGDPELAGLIEQLRLHPADTGLYLELASAYYARHDRAQFLEVAEGMRGHIDDPNDPEWQYVANMGRELMPEHSLFAQTAPPPLPIEQAPSFGGHTVVAPVFPPPLPSVAPPQIPPLIPVATLASSLPPGHDPARHEPLTWPHSTASQSTPLSSSAATTDHARYADSGSGLQLEPIEPAHPPAADEPPAYAAADQVDTKLDLARAYLDIDDPANARLMLEEVLQEGTQLQKETAQQLLHSLPPH